MQVYADKFGPLTIDTANPDAYWDWAKQPLPWEEWLLMWNYERRLQYPVNITSPNAKIAQIILSQLQRPGRRSGSSNYDVSF